MIRLHRLDRIVRARKARCGFHTAIPARVYDRLGMRDSAVTVYERYLGVRDLFRGHVDALELGDALVRLAELQEVAGDHDGAARQRRRLAELWRDADPELRRVVETSARPAVARDLR